ncbi:hypothetical protein AGMMS50267_16620 [Spirochaetia bacterium]|nr:hypothetical protein AGMMS50267_16620 [Spirochaetia bacterium]
MEIPWHGGREDAVLRITVDRDKRLIMETNGTGEKEIRGTRKSLTINEVRLLCGKNGSPYGLRVSYEYHGKTGYTIAPFSTFPVGTLPGALPAGGPYE